METFEELISQIDVDWDKFRNDMRELRGSSRNYVIFFVPRSGSSWLTDLLAGTCLLGEPEEWFNPNFVQAIAMGMNANRPYDYVKMLKRKKRSAGGIFGAEITYFQLARLGSFDLLDALGPDTRFFYLRRRNLVKQAISLYKAVESTVFHNKGTITDEMNAKIESVKYDRDALTHWTNHVLQHELGFEGFFQKHGLSPLRLYYEDIVTDPAATAALFLRELLANRAPETYMVRSSHQPIATAANSDFEEQFRRESRAFIADVDAKRPALL